MEKNIIFIHIPKTAGMSISKALHDANALKQGYGFTHNKAIDILKSTDNNSPVLAVVRNPYDRLYSIYEFYRTQQSFRGHKQDFMICDLINKKKTTVDTNITFREFILNFEQVYHNKQDQFTSCYDFIIDNNNNILSTDIIKFENLSNEYQQFCNKYNITNLLQYHNNNINKNNDIDWTKLYDNEMRKVVENIFRNDLIHFNYSYESFIRSKPRKIIKEKNLFFKLY